MNFRWTIGFVEDAEDAREWERCELVCGDLVSYVVPELVLGCAVPFLFLDDFEAAALLRISRVEYVWKKFDAFAQTFDDRKALMIERALDHLHHVHNVRGMCPRDEGGPARD